jgi:hypothetical protein
MGRGCSHSYRRLRSVFLAALTLLLPAFSFGAPARTMEDTAFLQPVSHKFPLPEALRGTVRKMCVDQDGIVYILTARGVARLLDDRVVLDQSYRPLAGKIPVDISASYGKLYYLYPDEFLCNRDAAKFVLKLSQPFFIGAMGSEREGFLASSNTLARISDGHITPTEWTDLPPIREMIESNGSIFARTDSRVYQLGSTPVQLASIEGLTAIAVNDGTLFCGSTNGLYSVKLSQPGSTATLDQHLPALNITALTVHGGDLWAATTEGIWRKSADGAFRYFASRRWLDDDHVISIQVSPDAEVFALTQSGLNEIEFRPMTLEQKAAWYDNKIRKRHIRYGFCAELHLKTPGDITTAEMVDTDNDGTWSNYYMASQAFRFAATGDEKARRNAWETFEALERLESINPLHGFPSRTFERVGFKVSDPDRWHPAGDGIWDWKAHTSSDEVIAHMFGSGVLYETTAKTPAEKERIAAFVSKVLDHIIWHNWYLIDVDGKPTLWARWNPEYVNAFPPSIFDRRLNSAEIIAALELGYKITRNETYKAKAFELLNGSGYLENILRPMSAIGNTPGFKHKGIEMGDEWNHSDDLLAFVTYWTLYHFAFNDELKTKFAAVIKDHWLVEREERNPLWIFVCASTGAEDCDVEGALWTLRGLPLDMIDWSVRNSGRHDITRLPPNFRGRELQELLPPDERRMTRWNSQPFILDGGSGGATELAGDEFLLPYWMGRYLKLIR